MPNPKRKTRNTAEILQILKELRESGLTQREFALNRNISISTLTSWVRKYRSAAKTEAPPPVIPVGTINSAPSPFEIEFPSGEILRIDAGYSNDDLRRILAELRKC